MIYESPRKKRIKGARERVRKQHTLLAVALSFALNFRRTTALVAVGLLVYY